MTFNYMYNGSTKVLFTSHQSRKTMQLNAITLAPLYLYQRRGDKEEPSAAMAYLHQRKPQQAYSILIQQQLYELISSRN